MIGLAEIHKLGYFIQSIHQNAPDSWYVCFRSPYEWALWQAHGKSLAVAAKKAARLALKRGPALEASYEYRARAAARLPRNRERLKPKRRRVRL